MTELIEWHDSVTHSLAHSLTHSMLTLAVKQLFLECSIDDVISYDYVTKGQIHVFLIIIFPVKSLVNALDNLLGPLYNNSDKSKLLFNSEIA